MKEIFMKTKTKKILIKIFPILSVLNKVIRKNENIIVIYSNLGFRDNIRSIYDYLIDNNYNKKYKIVCSLNDCMLFKEQTIENVKFVNCYTGLYYFFISKYFFYSFGKYPIRPSREQIVINLWHGMPLKTIGALVDKKNSHNYFSYVLATSEFFSNIIQNAFQCDIKQVLICGQPRNDDLFLQIDIKTMFGIKNKKTLCYMPTFRNSKILSVNDCETSIESIYSSFKEKEFLQKLDRILCELDFFLFVKPHPMDDFNRKFIDSLGNIKYINDQYLYQNNLNLYKFLSGIDGLLTDYSSVYFDYLLLDRAIGFIVDDIDEYKNKRGFIVDEPLEIMPGKHIYTYNDLLDFLYSFQQNDSNFKEARGNINNLCNFFKENGNCKKILELVGIKK